MSTVKSTRYLRYLGQRNPRLEAWWYQKRRKQPSGKLGRPRSPIPLAERRAIARANRRRQETAGTP